MSLNLNGSSSPISLFNGQQALLWGQRAACAPPVQREALQEKGLRDDRESDRGGDTQLGQRRTEDLGTE
uniref:Uncharacterized protein n=1 Tax=Rangifer tarandus platyrhynchus TaxID=3082113 RepID=A0ACB0DZ16_RANTA|nr:unnamed protein product [Rangifer tarandus platyrhynchus]